MIFKVVKIAIIAIILTFIFPVNLVNAENNIQPLKEENQLDNIPMGVIVNGRNVISSISVKAKEDGTKAINYDNWLLPLEPILQALKFTKQDLPDGKWQLRSSYLFVQVDPHKFINDPELGLAITPKQIEELLGIKSKFNLIEYAVEFELKNFDDNSEQYIETPVILDGLPVIKSPRLNIANIEQKINLSGTGKGNLNSQGDLSVVGTIYKSSYYLKINQPDLTDSTSWKISEGQIFKPETYTDYIIGSQPTFWRNSENVTGDYWGVTTIFRDGFSPFLDKFGNGGSVNPQQRLQAAQIKYTISGRAEPGTLVRLVISERGDRFIAEKLIDNTGIYRFENIPYGGQLGNNYYIFKYPKGQLTATPIKERANIDVLPGELEVGTSSLIVSGGLRRLSNNDLWGNFGDVTGGIAYKKGIAEGFTLGLGVIYDQQWKASGDFIFQPKKIPLRVILSALYGDKLDLNSNVSLKLGNIFDFNYNSDRTNQRYQILLRPLRGVNIDANSDNLSSRIKLNWYITPELELFNNNESVKPSEFGVSWRFNKRNFSTSIRLSRDVENQWRYNLNQTIGKLQLTQNLDDLGWNNEVLYDLTGNDNGQTGHAILLKYNTREINKNNDNFAQLSWRYRSKNKDRDGAYKLEAELGYGTGSQGGGIIASIGTTIIPKLLLRARYEGASLTNADSSFRIEITSSVNTINGFSSGDRKGDALRQNGGILLKGAYPNIAQLKNSGFEPSEINSKDLFLINNQPLKSYQVDQAGDSLLVKLPPGKYRIDLDPAGYPTDFQPNFETAAIEVIPGTYTPVIAEFIPSYTVSGVVKDNQGNPVGGAKIEAITTGKPPVSSITNEGGVYYLERLQRGNYKLSISGEKSAPDHIIVDEKSPAFKELNLILK